MQGCAFNLSKINLPYLIHTNLSHTNKHSTVSLTDENTNHSFA